MFMLQRLLPSSRRCLPSIALSVCLLLGAWSAAWATGNTWTGNGDGTNWSDPLNWSSGEPDAGHVVAIGSGASVLLTNATAELAAFTISDAATLTFDGWDSALTATEMTIAGTLTHLAQTATEPDPETGEWIPDHRIWLKGSNITIEAVGKLDADYLGYAPNKGPGGGSGTDVGAAHAGDGRRGRGGIPAAAYGEPEAPWQPGSGGGNRTNPTGGGSIRIEAAGYLVVEGELRARGRQGGAGSHYSGGAGGSIWLNCQTFAGAASGWIVVDGGTGRNYGAGGSGGRIALHYDPDEQSKLAHPVPPVRFSAKGGNPGSYDVFLPSTGTFFLPDTQFLEAPLTGQRLFHTRLVFPDITQWSPPALTIDNCVFGLPPGFRLEVGGDLILTNNAGLHVFAAPVNDPLSETGAVVSVTGDLRLGPGSWLKPYADPTNGATVVFTVGGDLAIADNGGIDADYAGYKYDHGYGDGTPADTRGGAGHAGQGSTSRDGRRGGAPYGDLQMPILPGSGGLTSGGRGGGAVRLLVDGMAEINGTISARASSGIPTHGSGGSGGSILLVCRTFRGASTGLLRVDGGSGDSYGGHGSAGRIALHYDPVAQAALADPIPSVRFSAYSSGFSGNGTIPAAYGTLFLTDTKLLETPEGDVVLDGHRFWYTRLHFGSHPRSWSPASMTIEDCMLGFAEGFELNVQHDLSLTGTQPPLVGGIRSGLLLYAEQTNTLYGSRLRVGRDLIVGTNSYIYTHTQGYSAAIVGILVGRDATIAAGAVLDGNYTGYMPQEDNLNGDGAGTDDTMCGSYGSLGINATEDRLYGLPELPLEPGSPGGFRARNDFTPSGAGGGAIQLLAGGRLTVDGIVRVNGRGDTATNGRSGSGGSIFLSGMSFGGSGTLQAQGGGGNGQGGGGRIAVWMSLPLNLVEERIAQRKVGLKFAADYSGFDGVIDTDGTKGFYFATGTLIRIL